MVEGPQAIGQGEDGLRRRHRILQNINSRYSHDVPSSLVQNPVAPRVPFRAIRQIMRQSINLDEQSNFDTCEIGDIVERRKLTPKFQSSGLAAELAPQQSLRQCHFPPQFTGELHRLFRRAQSPMAHPPQILPGTGRGTARRVVEGPSAIGHAHALDGEVPTPPSPLRGATSPFRGGTNMRPP